MMDQQSFEVLFDALLAVETNGVPIWRFTDATFPGGHAEIALGLRNPFSNRLAEHTVSCRGLMPRGSGDRLRCNDALRRLVGERASRLGGESQGS